MYPVKEQGRTASRHFFKLKHYQVGFLYHNFWPNWFGSSIEVYMNVLTELV